MKKQTLKNLALASCMISLSLTACKTDDDGPTTCCLVEAENVVTPENYEFTRNGMSSVSYSGQTDRLNQVAEMKAYLQNAANNKTLISEQALNDMFENTNGDGNGNFSFSSSKQLSNKTFDLDRSVFTAMFTRAASASTSAMANVTASNGQAGLLTRSNGSAMLVDENGHEFTQELEKGLMGATFYNQIVNAYLTEDKIGDAVNNSMLVTGKNYTDMEHHFDEAFGYFGAPQDFKSNYSGTETPRYWADYSNDYDALTGLNDKLMNAFKRGRQAIVEKKYTVKDIEVQVLYAQLEVLIAASAIHYINSSLGETNDADRLHTLSEAYFFLKALRYSNINNRALSQTEVSNMLNNDFGNNFWNITSSGLVNIKNKLSTTYGLTQVKNQL